MGERWTPESWRAKPVQQMPEYPDQAALKAVEQQLAGFPPLVFAGEARKLKRALSKVAAGEAFLLQGGDCAESFAEHSADNIRDFFRLFLQMAVVLTFAGGSPVVKVGRIAGQFAKPRSAPNRDDRRRRAAELQGRHHQRQRVHGGVPDSGPAPPARGLPAVGGDAESAPRLRDRRLRQSRQRASLDARLRQGFAGLASLPGGLAERITEALDFMRAIGIDPETHPEMRTTDFYTSHEALLLGYEQAMTRVDSTTGDWYATSGHMVWIGDRTRQLDHAHVEYFRGIKNPIGLKCGPSPGGRRPAQADRRARTREPGRAPDADRPLRRRQGLRAPAGAGARRQARRAATSSGPAIRCTATRSRRRSGYKTRPFDLILGEVKNFFAVHQAEGTYAGGLHLEMTGKNVTECTGGARGDDRRRPQRPLPHGLRSAPQCGAGAGSGLQGLGNAETPAAEPWSWRARGGRVRPIPRKRKKARDGNRRGPSCMDRRSIST
jgi:3-deoxy-7-phosphoheptulonate synthase